MGRAASADTSAAAAQAEKDPAASEAVASPGTKVADLGDAAAGT